jgi:phenylpyruvate tautomerase PptA (4-oxalocrotonate tautomerase family)
MPMIDVYATAGTFTDKHRLAADLAATLMRIEGVPDIPMFRQNTAGFVHELPAGDLSNVDGASDYVRVQVLTNAGALDRDKQIAVVRQFTDIVADAAHDPALAGRTWVLLTEAVPGGWGLEGHANTNDELVAAARKQIAELQAKAAGSCPRLWHDMFTSFLWRPGSYAGAALAFEELFRWRHDG